MCPGLRLCPHPSAGMWALTSVHSWLQRQGFYTGQEKAWHCLGVTAAALSSAEGASGGEGAQCPQVGPAASRGEDMEKRRKQGGAGWAKW